MLPTPRRPEIDHRTIKLIVGGIAISLPFLTSILANAPLTSISASYYETGWSQSIFIGFLFAIAAFLLAYNGRSRNEMLLSKLAALAGLCVALFPCACDGHPVRVLYVHYIAASVMFVVLAEFCYIFYRRARRKGFAEANVRAGLYAVCGCAIVLSIVVLALNALFDHVLEARIPGLIFDGEAVGLVAFGISWLNASHVLPGVNRPDERFSPLSDRNPG
jgi:hypothetical protein